LKAAAHKFEDIPEESKDWHPGSAGQVLDLVHPSMYCVRYGRTQAFIPGASRTTSNLLVLAPPDVKVPGDQPWLVSEDFSWLPSDFKVGADGAVHLVSPYINNIHPEHHQPLYRVLEEVLTVLVPMFESVLGGIIHGPTTPGSGRLQLTSNVKSIIQHTEYVERDDISCIWGGDGPPYPTSREQDENIFQSVEDFQATEEKILPESYEAYTGALEDSLTPISLQGRTIQCIVKLANIHLTPEKPEYSGGSWHVEGANRIEKQEHG
jgi:hypothetical protein